MAVDYTMTVTRLDVYPEIDGKQNMVYSAAWTLAATDGSKTFRYPGRTAIPYNPSTDFVDYDALTEDEILRWIFKTVPNEITAVRASLALNFASTLVEDNKPLPW